MWKGISEETILSVGFKIDSKQTHSDMGQSSFELTSYSKDNELFLIGGYWTWIIKNKEGKEIYKGWWNSNDEFINTINNLSSQKL